jgi:hypothetical protein
MAKARMAPVMGLNTGEGILKILKFEVDILSRGQGDDVGQARTDNYRLNRVGLAIILDECSHLKP